MTSVAATVAGNVRCDANGRYTASASVTSVQNHHAASSEFQNPTRLTSGRCNARPMTGTE